jgi:hypothetical protein
VALVGLHGGDLDRTAARFATKIGSSGRLSCALSRREACRARTRVVAATLLLSIAEANFAGVVACSALLILLA